MTHSIEVVQVAAEARELSGSGQEREDIVGAVGALVQVPVKPSLVFISATTCRRWNDLPRLRGDGNTARYRCGLSVGAVRRGDRTSIDICHPYHDFVRSATPGGIRCEHIICDVGNDAILCRERPIPCRLQT